MSGNKLFKNLINSAMAAWFPRYYMAYRFARENQNLLNTVKETPMGFKFVGNENMESGIFEPDETAIVRKILPKIDIFINVGANIGYYCGIALKEQKKVIAFEPVESNLHLLYKNIKANNWDKEIEIYPIALSDRTGIIEIYGKETGASLIKGWDNQSEDYVRFVPLSTLDIVAGSRFTGKRCFLLVDIEGAEDQMMKGAGTFLSMNPKPVWLVEISISEHQPKGVAINPNLLSTFNKFWENGYEAWTADKNIRLIDRNEIETIAKGGTDTIKTHNFLFIEKQKKSEYFRPD